MFERIVLAAGTTWRVEAEKETWIFCLAGRACCGAVELCPGEAVYAMADRVDVRVGSEGITALVAYSASRPVPNLLQRLASQKPADPSRQTMLQGDGNRQLFNFQKDDALRVGLDPNQ